MVEERRVALSVNAGAEVWRVPAWGQALVERRRGVLPLGGCLTVDGSAMRAAVAFADNANLQQRCATHVAECA